MIEQLKKYGKVKYPVKLGYSDKSGREENQITDANDRCIVGGFGDCCKIGGIQERKIALTIIKILNKVQPNFKVPYFEDKREVSSNLPPR